MSIPNIPIQEFYLLRTEDESGTSGIGIVARGVIMPSGACHVEWLSHVHTETRFDNISHVELIHSHGGNTKVIMGPPPLNNDEIEESEPKKKTRKTKK